MGSSSSDDDAQSVASRHSIDRINPIAYNDEEDYLPPPPLPASRPGSPRHESSLPLPASTQRSLPLPASRPGSPPHAPRQRSLPLPASRPGSPPHAPRPPPNLPDCCLLASREKYNEICVPLFQASIIGDWKVAQDILDRHPEVDLVRCSITENGDTALHIAASATSSRLVEKFVINLVDRMDKKDLELQNKNYNTALCLAASNGNVKVVRIMLKRNEMLLSIPGAGGDMLPLYIASLYGKSGMVNYLYDHSRNLRDDGWTPTNRGWLLQKCVEADLFDVAFKILTDHPKLARNREVLGILARKTYALEGRKRHFIWGVLSKIIHVKVGPPETPSNAMLLLRRLWANITKLPKEKIDKIMGGPVEGRTYSSGILFVAAEMGNTEFIVELIRGYPELIWKVNNEHQTIFHVAVAHRHVGIYNLLYEIGSMKDMITPLKDLNGNNLLHLAGKKPKGMKHQGALSIALHLQQELLWFMEVKSIMPPTYLERKNDDSLRPQELFLKEHKKLASANEEWMKGAANQSLVIATLIASIGFAVAFTVPGGYNQNDGIPMFIHKRSLLIFIISDGISLTSSSIAILIFLSFFTTEPDFGQTLTKKLSHGLASLFLSITAMLVAFIVNLFVIYHDSLIWVPIFMSILISISVILYGRLHSQFLVDLYCSTYGSKNIFNRKKNVLFHNNPKF